MRRQSKPELVALALLAYGPFLLSSPGRISADSKQYLYLDPGRFLARATDLWDPTIGAGTVPHQHLGYAFPVGPLFWAFDRLGVPDWVAQRLWLGTVTFLAAVGARWLFEQLGTGRVGALAGALVYALTPYQLAFTAGASVLLTPWAALPWLVGLTMRATRTGGWRPPAALGLVLVLAGGINASALALVALGPVLWVVVDATRGRAQTAAALRAAMRLAAVGLGVSAWWLVGVRLQGTYGLPVLQLTENVRTVAERSSPGDVLRGLGNWVFFSRDGAGYVVDQAEAYDRDGLVVALSYAVPVVGLMAALAVRWAHRTYFGLLVVIGVVVAVGSSPVDDPSFYGSIWERFTSDTSVGLAFRNSPRAVPLLVLGFAGLLAAAVGAVPRVRWERPAGAVVAVVALGALLPVWQTGYLSERLDRSEDIPTYWTDAIADIDAGDHGTRVLELPGSTFAAYRWGNLVDPLTPGLTDRPYLAREILPYGTAPSINLLDALDRRAQLGILEPAAVVPVARLFGVGTISLRGDLERSDRAFSPPPGPVWEALVAAEGLAPPRPFGPAGGDGSDPGLPSVALFDVEDPQTIVRAAPVAAPILLAGDGDGIVDAAAAGLIVGQGLVLQATGLDDDTLEGALDAGAHLVLTDSNRRRIQTWFYALRDTRGPTERAGRTAPDPTGYDFRLDPFPGSGDDSRTVVQQVGGRVEATSEGGPDRPEDRGANAVDGDPGTAWRVGGDDPVGQAITIVPDRPITIDRLQLVQPASARTGRSLAKVRIRLGDGDPIDVDLGPDSLRDGGQAVLLPEQVVDEVRVEVLATVGTEPGGGLTPVGLAEVGVGATEIDEVVRLPVDLLGRVGTGTEGHSLDVVLTRLRLDLADPTRQDDEAHLDRRFELPLGRSFSLTAEGRVPAGLTPTPTPVDDCRDDLLTIDGRPLALRPVAGSPSGGDEVVRLEACGPVDLGAGSHRVTAASGALTGLDLDRLVLASDATGAPTPVGPRGVADDGPPIRVIEEGATRIEVEVGAAEGPFWLVLGQSRSEGWTASADGAQIGPRTLVDGYANGWLVTPAEEGSLVIDLRWGPQRHVWVGAAISAIAVVGCGFILALGRRRPRPDAGLTEAGWPRIGLSRDDGLADPVAALTAGGVVAVGAVLVADPGVAFVGFVMTVVAGLLPRGRALLVVAAPVALVLSRLEQRPALAWLAAALLVGDLMLGRRDLRGRATPG
ncbi:MAG: alpha-(1-_3)-arabinofuranosyltransferase family protein [Acidimicrobiales bacterium]